MSEPFICTQFPIAPLSAECYKERKAGSSQTLTGLGKWWGRKPLILVRSILLGLLMPGSGNLGRDRAIFLKILTMDEDGLKRRQKKKADWRELRHASHAEKIANAFRPEEIDGPDAKAWAEINQHLGTSADSLPGLFEELSIKRFGGRAKVGDCFCGGGTIPFEAARMGCDVYASDLNPIACLLTWGALNIVGGGPDKVAEVKAEQEKVYAAVEKQIEEWGIERSEEGWRAEYYLYCVEVPLPDGWRVPLAPSWVIGKKTNTVAKLVPDFENKRFEFKVKMGASEAEMEAAAVGTIAKGFITNPATGDTVKLSVLRGDRKEVVGHDENGKEIKEGRNNLRQWEAGEWKPRPDDFYQERLYCIRWRDAKGEAKGKAVYRAPTAFDLETEAKVEARLAKRFEEWQAEGHIPSLRIEPGYNTTQPIRERGWTHWHQLFNARQLLVNGSLLKHITQQTICPLLKITDFNSSLARWCGDRAAATTFSNQALNTIYNYPVRGLSSLEPVQLPSATVNQGLVIPSNAMENSSDALLWITDPPYADAINYDELSEFFLAWIEKKLPKLFPDWYADSKRALAVRGSESETFEDTLVEIYGNLRQHTLPGGMQVVMFTHSSNEVWLSLTRVIRRAGLQVLAVWAVRTETDNASKGEGNYVKATYLVVLKAREARAPKPKFQVRGEVVKEVERLLGDMDSINQGGELNFKYGDLLLAAPTAVMRVMTGFEEIRGLNPLERNAFEAEMLKEAEKYRDQRLYPGGFDGPTWEKLGSGERFYLMNLHQETKGDTSQELYQLSSKAYGVTDYKPLLASKKANEARLMTPLEIQGRAAPLRLLGEDTLTAALLGATWQAEKHEDAQAAHRHLRDALGTLTPESAATLRTICRFLLRLKHLEHWEKSTRWLEEIELGIGRI
ncbi:MAG: DUF1156 domain-containing protein [Verrucomicrobia bacterium]|nr:DUF1156 domain-containing protein [Verrucomicrobiota bacterium]